MSDLKPISSNNKSNSCGDMIGSNCVSWDGGTVAGVCSPANLTDVINQLNQNNGCCSGNFAAGNMSAYIGKWIDISGGIPISGTGVGSTYAVTGFGAAGSNNPGYMWTTDGDLKVRGAISFTITPTVNGGSITIPLVALFPINFPVNWTGSQTILTSVDFDATIGIVQMNLAGQAYLRLNYPTGVLFLDYFYIDINLAPITVTVDFGGSRFNIA